VVLRHQSEATAPIIGYAIHSKRFLPEYHVELSEKFELVGVGSAPAIVNITALVVSVIIVMVIIMLAVMATGFQNRCCNSERGSDPLLKSKVPAIP